LRSDDPANAAVGAQQQGYDLSKLKMVIGGAALTKALAKAAMQRGHRHLLPVTACRVRPHPDDRAA